MTATERLRELLDERGVEWTEGIARPELTQVRIDGKVVKFHPWQPNTLKVSLFDITPEQAIAAILGSSNCSNNCTNSERTGAPRLPHFWTHDGVLHIELPKLPDFISVLLPDQRDREVRSARVWLYTRDSGTCHDVGDPSDFCCSECGVRMFTDTSDTYTMIASDGRTIIKHPNYCPNCGRKVVDA